jgi:putative mRNA 3-end processing factor
VQKELQPEYLGLTRISVNGGLVIEHDGIRYALDPKVPTSADYAFVSHAHLDHMHSPSRKSKIIASKETASLAMARGYDLGSAQDPPEGVDLLDSGHILGSRAIRIGDEVLYTGDAAGRERAFLGKFKARHAQILIIESTYGNSEYCFPATAKVIREVNTLVSEVFDKGRPVILMGYPLGKAQVLAYLFSSWSPLFLHESVARMNEVHSLYGVELRTGRVVTSSNMLEDQLPHGPWALISPIMNSHSKVMRKMKKDYGAVLIGFSGWAVSGGYRYALGIDHAFPMSDHCDYNELMKLVQQVSPERVYTVHGFTEQFAHDLRMQGFEARPLGSYQSTLLDFSKPD